MAFPEINPAVVKVKAQMKAPMRFSIENSICLTFVKLNAMGIRFLMP